VIKRCATTLNALFKKARAINAKLEFGAFIDRLVAAAVKESTEAVAKAVKKNGNGDLEAMKMIAAYVAKAANHTRKPAPVAAG
jgi:hypothetical protein